MIKTLLLILSIIFFPPLIRTGITSYLPTQVGNVGIGTFDPSGGRLIVIGGNVGIASVWPGKTLDVQGTVRATAFSGDGSALTGVSAGGFTDDGSYVHLTTSTDNVGIGTVDASQGKLIITGGNVGIGSTNPNHALVEITGDAAKEMLRINDGGPNDITPIVITSAGNIGIGTTSTTTTYKVDIVGALRVSSTLQGGGFTLGGQSALDDLVVGVSIASGSSINMWTSGAATKVVLSSYNGANYRSMLEFGNVASGESNMYLIRTAGNIGIATTGAPSKLTIMGNVGIGTVGGAYTTITAPANGLIVQGNVGIGTFNPFGGQLIVPTTNGNVGIGSLAPGQALDVTGTVRATAFSGDGSLLTGVSAGFTDDGTTVRTTTNSDNVGIGTNTVYSRFVVMNGNVGIATFEANAFLDVTSTVAQDLFRVNDNGTGDTTPFIITSTGNVGIGTTLTTTAGVSIMNGNVGIGTWIPSAALEVKGGSGAQSQITISGSSGGCLMFRDTDNAGWTECNALDGLLTCSVDADGVCDGS